MEYTNKIISKFMNDNIFLSDQENYIKNCKEIVLIAVQHDNTALENASAKLKDDEEIVLAAIKYNSRALAYASARLRNLPKVVRFALEYDTPFWAIGTAIQYDIEFWRKNIKSNSQYYSELPDNLRNDKKIALKAAKHNSYVLMSTTSLEFRMDPEIIITAVKNSVHAFQFAYHPNDKTKLACCKINGLVLKYFEKPIKPIMIYHAVKNWGVALRFAGEPYINMRKYVKLAAKTYGGILEYVDKKFTLSGNIVWAAISNDGMALQFADEKFKKDYKFAIRAVKQIHRALNFAHGSLFEDKEFIYELLQLDVNIWKFSSKLIKILQQAETKEEMFGYLQAFIAQNKLNYDGFCSKTVDCKIHCQ